MTPAERVARDSTQAWLMFVTFVLGVFALGIAVGMSWHGVWVPKN
jgi:hypothetical protein